ncbi:uncharacterized protein BDV17DRAFT_273755 [Aspergillus undulatus]|uniref:uncharacterized protein n=1 Tax=Aspergillus undulatus TaxID=1810928 RepID=UPI003CCCD751
MWFADIFQPSKYSLARGVDMRGIRGDQTPKNDWRELDARSPSCVWARALKKRAPAPDELLNRRTIEEITRPCPECHVATEKAGGCKYMRCMYIVKSNQLLLQLVY